MPRKKENFKKNWAPDSKYNSLLVGRFISLIMLKGKKSIAQDIIYNSFEIVHKKTKRGGLNVFEQAIKNVSPLMELKSRRIGGANYQVPVPVLGDRRSTLAMRWIREAARTKKGNDMATKLAEEFIDAADKKGEAMKKRENVHKMAEANKAFAHFA